MKLKKEKYDEAFKLVSHLVSETRKEKGVIRYDLYQDKGS
jgi:quinol monooxygenase YgiN